MLEFGSSGEQQRSHARAWCRTTKSGLATRRRVSPAWPSWPPLALPDLPRRLRGARGFFFNPSLEGGFELFVLSSPSRRRSSATTASSSAIRRSLAASNSAISAGIAIPPLIQIRPPPSPTIRQPKEEPVAFRTHPRLGVTRATEQGINSREQGSQFAIAGKDQGIGSEIYSRAPTHPIASKSLRRG